ncbi:MAG: GspE/PulE family protein [Wenzhouxiangella sp.]
MNKERTTGKAGSERTMQAQLAARLRQTLRDHHDEREEAETTIAEASMRDAIAARATDIHLDPLAGRYRVRFRVDGVMVDVAELQRDDGRRLVNQFRALARIDPVASHGPDDGRFSYALDEASLDVRVTGAPCIAGEKLAIRLLAPERVRQDVADLGLDERELEYLRAWLDGVGGMALVAGPTGSGKTTTLYSLLHQLTMTDQHVITLEDPVEYEIPGINQMPVDPARGWDFPHGAQAMLRLDPDYLVIGELTESESARAAANAAAGGKATMATLHSRDAVDTVTVLRNYGLDDFEVASNLQLVVAQRLVRRLCPDCCEQQPPADRDRRWLKAVDVSEPEHIWVGRGCSSCKGMGYKGRVGVFEVWRPSDEEYGLILDHAGAHDIRSRLAERSHRFLLDDGLEKAEAGVTSLSELRNLGALSAATARGRASLVSG